MSSINFDFATQDDCLDKMVPSDLRQLVSERDTLRAELEALSKQEPFVWVAAGDSSQLMPNGSHRKVLWASVKGVGTPLYARPIPAATED